MTLPTLLDLLHPHLQQVRNDPSTPLDQVLLGHFDKQTSEILEEPWRDTLLNQLSDLLPTLQQDPMPVINLITVLVLPMKYDFTRLFAIQPPLSFLAGLVSPAPSINLAALSLLEKATYRKSDIDIVAGMASVVYELIKLWLRTPDTEVATRAQDVIVRFLLGDKGEKSMSDSGMVNEGLMWRRIFRDKDIYGFIFTTCSQSTAGQEGQLSRREKTIPQARLLDILLKIDSNPVRTSQIPEVEQRFGVENGGLLQFAALHMVEYQDDVMMHMTLIEFYDNYLRSGNAFALQFLQSNGLHAHSMAYYLKPEKQNSHDLKYLYGSSAKYLATYCSIYPQDLLSSPTADHILSRVTQALGSTSSSQWAQGNIPKHDLHVLVSLPRVMLIPSTHSTSPLFLIPVKPANPDALRALAFILHDFRESTPEEKAAGRALFYLEMEHFPDFWECIVTAADTVALTESALAAIFLIGAVITAEWLSLPDTESSVSTPYKLPTEREIASRCHAESLPLSGVQAIMTQPALGIVIPYLMRQAQNFGSLVGGGRGDIGSAAYRIAAAKHDVLEQLYQNLREWPEISSEGQEMMAAVCRRIAQGPMGGTTDVGGQVGTMEL